MRQAVLVAIPEAFPVKTNWSKIQLWKEGKKADPSLIAEMA